MNSKTKIPSVSIALCTYNGEKYIIEQLDSILNQTQKPDEIVISDDGSEDNTLEIIRNYISNNNDSEISIKLLINNADNSGVAGNFENAIKNTSGDIVFLSIL